MSKFKGFRQASSNILRAFGGSITYQQIATGLYNSSTGTISETITEHTIKGFLENVVNAEVNELISQNDKKLNVSAQDLTFTPTTKDKIIISSIEYKIIQIDTDMAENTDVKYIFYLRA